MSLHKGQAISWAVLTSRLILVSRIGNHAPFKAVQNWMGASKFGERRPEVAQALQNWREAFKISAYKEDSLFRKEDLNREKGKESVAIAASFLFLFNPMRWKRRNIAR